MRYSVADDDNEAEAKVAAGTMGLGSWHKLLPVMTLVLGVASVGAWYVPVYPDLGLPVGIFLVIGWLCLLALSIDKARVMQKSMQRGSEYGSTIARTGRNTLTYREIMFPTGFLLSTGMAMALFAGTYMIFGVLRNDYAVDLSLGFSVAAFLCIGVVALLSSPPVRATAFARWLARPVVRVIFGLGLFILVAGLSWFLGLRAYRFLTTGPAASQPQLFEFAKKQASRVDNAVILNSVSAGIMYDAPGPYSPDRTPMSVDFRFLAPSGEIILVEVLDTDPPRLRRITNLDYNLAALTPERLSLPETLEASLKLGPRQVYQLTAPAAERFAQSKGLTLQPSLRTYLECNCQEQFGVPLIWEVGYRSPEFKTELSFIVDASTGNVLHSTEGQGGTGNTALPTTSPTVAP